MAIQEDIHTRISEIEEFNKLLNSALTEMTKNIADIDLAVDKAVVSFLELLESRGITVTEEDWEYLHEKVIGPAAESLRTKLYEQMA